jgi:membrane protein EpsK
MVFRRNLPGNENHSVLGNEFMNRLCDILNRTLSMVRNNPDYFGAVLTGFAFIGLSIGLQVILVPLYLSKLGFAEFGVLMILLSLVNFSTVGVYGFASNALRILSEQKVAENEEAFADVYSVSRIIILGYGSVVTLGMVGIVLWRGPSMVGTTASSSDAADVTAALLLTAFYLLFLFEMSLNRVALNASGRQMAGNLVQLIQYAIFGITVVPSLFIKGKIWVVIACLLFGCVSARCWSWMYWRRAGLPHVYWGWRKGTLRKLKRPGRSSFGFFIYTILCFVMLADVLIIGWLAGAEAAASFVLVWKIAEIILQMLGRVPEHLQVEFMHMDAAGNSERLSRVYRVGLKWTRLSALAAGIGYAVFGRLLVRFWVGAEHAPNTVWGYWLAGSAIFLLGSARLPALLSYARVRMQPLLIVAGVEWGAKLALMILLFPTVGYIAPLIAINMVHLCGVAIAYARLGRRSLAPLTI